MRARGIVEGLNRNSGALLLTHTEDVEGFAAGDELYTHADVPELVALELKRRGKTSGPFVLSERDERLVSAWMQCDSTSDAYHIASTVRRAARTLGPQAAGEWEAADVHAFEKAYDYRASFGDMVQCDEACVRVGLDAVKHRLRPPLVLPSAEPQPDAPTDIAALPDYWDERRRRQGKPDLSRCAAELRVALASSAEDKLTAEERAHVNALRHASEDGEALLVAIIDRLAPDPDPVSPAFVDAVCTKMDLVGSMDRSFAQAVLETAHALRKAGGK